MFVCLIQIFEMFVGVTDGVDKPSLLPSPLILARLFMETRVQKFSIFFLLTPKNIDFFSTSNSDSPRNSLQNELSLTSVHEFLRKIERNYVFGGNSGSFSGS